MKLPKNIIPAQVKGAKTGAVAHKHCKNRTEAQKLYESAVRRMTAINDWHCFAGWDNTKFYLHDADGSPVAQRAPQQGDLIRIQLPLPANAEEKFDWVRIERIASTGQPADAQQSFAIKVRPTADPRQRTSAPAHFYTSHATSSFCVVRHTNTVWALELGRNEVPNMSGSLLNRLRNFIVALTARLGAAKSQWKALVNGVLEEGFSDPC